MEHPTGCTSYGRPLDRLAEARRIFREYAEPDSLVDAGNLYWALGVVIEALATASGASQGKRAAFGVITERLVRCPQCAAMFSLTPARDSMTGEAP